MKFSLLFASGVLAFVAVVGAQASYSDKNSYPLNDRYSDNGCGYDCRNTLISSNHYQQPGARSAYGPYHSYAVRPAVYGGQGMYHYRGYARHPLPPANAHYKIVRSYPTRSGPASHYGLRPVKALVLAPAYNGNSGPRYAYRPARYNNYNNYNSYNKTPRGHGGAAAAYSGARYHRATATGYPAPQRQYHNGAARYNRGGSRGHSAAGGY